VRRPVQLAVPTAVQPVPDDRAARGRDRSGARVGGERRGRGEPTHVTDFTEDLRGYERPHPADREQVRRRGLVQQRGDLALRRHPEVAHGDEGTHEDTEHGQTRAEVAFTTGERACQAPGGQGREQRHDGSDAPGPDRPVPLELGIGRRNGGIWQRRDDEVHDRRPHVKEQPQDDREHRVAPLLLSLDVADGHRRPDENQEEYEITHGSPPQRHSSPVGVWVLFRSTGWWNVPESTDPQAKAAEPKLWFTKTMDGVVEIPSHARLHVPLKPSTE